MLSVLHGDSVQKLAELDAASIHLIVTSPPYDNLRTYGGCSWDFEGTAYQMFRVLAPGGVVCWVVNDGVENGSESVTSKNRQAFVSTTR
jgi:DNA modification methylase